MATLHSLLQTVMNFIIHQFGRTKKLCVRISLIRYLVVGWTRSSRRREKNAVDYVLLQFAEIMKC